MNNVAQIIAGLLGGVGTGLQDVTENRRRNTEIQLRQRAQQQQEQESQFNQLSKVYESLSPDTDIDPAAAQRFAGAGLSLNKSPNGMARRPMSIAEKASQQSIKASDVQIQSAQEDMKEKQDRRAFFDSISRDKGSMQEFMSKPSEQRQMILMAHGVNSAGPQSDAEEAATDLAKSTGELAVAKQQGADYYRTALARPSGLAGMLSADDVDQAKFQAEINRRLATDNAFQNRFKAAQAYDKANPGGGAMQALEQAAMQEFRTMFKGRMTP